MGRPESAPTVLGASRAGTRTTATENLLPERTPAVLGASGTGYRTTVTEKWWDGSRLLDGETWGCGVVMAGTEAGMDDELTLEQVRERVEDVRVAMVTTVEGDGALSSRPLTVQQITDDGGVDFLVTRDAGWRADGQRVDVALVDEGTTWVSVSGTALYVDDPAAVDELWDDVSKQFFDDKADAIVMRVSSESWSYWAAPNRLAQIFEMAKAFVTDDTPDLGTKGEIDT